MLIRRVIIGFHFKISMLHAFCIRSWLFRHTGLKWWHLVFWWHACLGLHINNILRIQLSQCIISCSALWFSYSRRARCVWQLKVCQNVARTDGALAWIPSEQLCPVLQASITLNSFTVILLLCSPACMKIQRLYSESRFAYLNHFYTIFGAYQHSAWLIISSLGRYFKHVFSCSYYNYLCIT